MEGAYTPCLGAKMAGTKEKHENPCHPLKQFSPCARHCIRLGNSCIISSPGAYRLEGFKWLGPGTYRKKGLEKKWRLVMPKGQVAFVCLFVLMVR